MEVDYYALGLCHTTIASIMKFHGLHLTDRENDTTKPLEKDEIQQAMASHVDAFFRNDYSDYQRSFVSALNVKSISPAQLATLHFLMGVANLKSGYPAVSFSLTFDL